jgi:hypothetical protein
LKLSANHIIKVIIFFIFTLPLTFAQQDTVQKKIDNPSDTAFVMSKSPLGAVLRSAVIPGWGQIYTESYWKVPVIWGAAAWLIYNWIWNNNQYKQFNNLFNQTSNTDDLSYAHFYEDQRDLFAIYMGLTYLLNLVDAYIDAQLFDFSVSRDPVTNSAMLNMRLKF